MNKEKALKILKTICDLAPLVAGACISYTMILIESLLDFSDYESLSIIGLASLIAFAGIIATTVSYKK